MYVRACLHQLLTVPPAVLREVYGVDVSLGLEVVGEAGGVEEIVAVVRSVQLDLLLLALSMPQTSRLDGVTTNGHLRVISLHHRTSYPLGLDGAGPPSRAVGG